jgi:hypothetical protein
MMLVYVYDLFIERDNMVFYFFSFVCVGRVLFYRINHSPDLNACGNRATSRKSHSVETALSRRYKTMLLSKLFNS